MYNSEKMMITLLYIITVGVFSVQINSINDRFNQMGEDINDVKISVNLLKGSVTSLENSFKFQAIQSALNDKRIEAIEKEIQSAERTKGTPWQTYSRSK